MPTRVKKAKQSGCVHHWEIAPPNGPTSDGTCKNCGEVKGFSNSIFVDMHHITLEKESADAEREEKHRRWNPWQGE